MAKTPKPGILSQGTIPEGVLVPAGGQGYHRKMPPIPAWPYPRWIAHRGAGTLAPENTLPAFALGARHGWRMFECDARLSADGVLFLLHDHTLERTTNGSGPAGQRSIGALAQLDAGSWHSRAYAGAAIPTLEALVLFCLANGLLLNVEIKPNPGQAQQTGQAVGELLACLWPDDRPAPLLSSFHPSALDGARSTAPALPRGLLVDSFAAGAGDGRIALTQAAALDCRALILNYRLWLEHPALVAQAHGAALRCLGYTVNDPSDAQRLIGLGIDGLITDRIDLFASALPGQSDLNRQ